MILRINRNNFVYCLLYLIPCFFCILFTYVANESNGYFNIAIACLVEIILFLWFHRLISGTLISFGSIFMLVLAIFHFGQVFICGFWEESISELLLRIVLKYFPDESCVYALRLINISFVCIGLGILASLTYQPISEKTVVIEPTEAGLNERRAILIIIISFPIKAVIDMIAFVISFRTGFLASTIWLGNFPDFIRTIGNFSMIGFALWIISLENKPKKQMRVFVVIIAYLAFTMISGRRSETVAYIVIMAYLFLRSSQRKKIRVRTVITYGIAGYILLSFMYTVVRIRDMDGRTIADFFDLFWVLLTKQNIFMEALREYGNTGYTAVCVIVNWLQNYPPSYGKSYYMGLSAIFPNIGGFVGHWITDSTYAIQLQQYGMVLSGFKNIGGSVIGELFFNFGIMGGIIASPILGVFIGFVSDKVAMHLRASEIMKSAYYIPIMFATLYWIRDCFGDGVREVVWGVLLCYIMKKISIRTYRGGRTEHAISSSDGRYWNRRDQ